MNEIELLEQPAWNPFAWLGLEYDFLKIHTSIILNTWFALILLIIFVALCRYGLRKQNGILHYCIITSIKSFMDFSTQTIGFFHYPYFALAFSFFTFILICNCIALIPWTVEPTKDINTTLAFGLIIFLYKDWQGIRTHGLRGFLKEFTEPLFLMFPVNLIGHFSKIISISFRLFGNIFGGAVILELYRAAIETSVIAEIVGLITGFNFVVLLFFGFFEGLIQAFVFAMLSLTYIALAVQKEDHG